jgi:hypothetical protein
VSWSSCAHELRVECAVVFVWVGVFMNSELVVLRPWVARRVRGCVRVGVGVYEK